MSNIERRKLIPKTPPTERFSKIPKLKKFLFTLATTTVLLLPFSSQVLATSKPKKINLWHNLAEVQPQIGNRKDELVAQNIDIKKTKEN